MDHLQFEKKVLVTYHHCQLTGFVDVYDAQQHHVWELKVIKEVEPTHSCKWPLYME